MQAEHSETTAVELPMGIDVVIRVHDVRRMHELDRALLSLVNQTFAPVNPIIATQNFSSVDLQTLDAVVDKYEWDDKHRRPTIFNVNGARGADLRSRLLNESIAKATHQFLAFLDSDDYIYEHAYSFLVAEALEKKVAIAFGDIVVKHVRDFGAFIYNLKVVRNSFKGGSLAELVDDNFCPIHSFVVDRSAIQPEDLYFDEKLTRLEDYDFLLRICAKYPASFEGRKKAVGVYNWHVDGNNSIQVFSGEDAATLKNKSQWLAARRHIWRLKTRIRTKLGLDC